MDMIASPVLLMIGLVFLAAGYFIIRRAKGQSLVDATTDATWESVKNRDIGALRQHLEGTIADISTEQSNAARARKLAGLAAREAMSRVMRVSGIVSILGGLLVAALGIFWK